MKCNCIPGRFLCGNYGLDISSVLNEVEGPVDIRCHESGFSDCYIRELVISKTLAAIIGDDAINMMCSVGQCVHYSQLPSYQKISHETSKSNMFIGVSTALLTVYLVLQLIKVLVHGRNTRNASISVGEAHTKPTHADSTKPRSAYKTTGDEIDDMLQSTQQATVSFRDICYTIPTQGPDLVSLHSLGIDTTAEKINPSTNTQSNINVLKGISGIVHPGQILAILGASGAGKSTLLDILSRREKCGNVSGKVLVNDCDLISGITTGEFHRISGYVDQQDLHVATATVYESVMTSALLRLPRKMSMVAKEKRVCEILTELGLWSVRNSKIGKNGARGISGGEMRRVSIACELVTSPSIIFLDEPTSGLDAYNAFVVMNTLSQLTRRYGRTVICTIHQPRTDIFSMFDKLIVLAAGQMCYSGPASEMSGYLKSIGHAVPDGYNVADFSVDLVQQATAAHTSMIQPVLHNKAAHPQTNATTSNPDNSNVTQNAILSDGEWSPLLKSSQLALAAEETTVYDSKNHNTELPSHAQSRDEKQLIYVTKANLHQILESFLCSPHHGRIMNELDIITGSSWEFTKFEMISSAGMAPHNRP
ncbi:(ABC) transporter, partial [Coemansia sp. RSA 988]